MSKLTDFKLLSFDVYGTLIDWETGFYDAVQPLLKKNNRTDITKKELLELFHKLESQQQAKTPGLKYSELVATVHPQLANQLAETLGLEHKPTEEESKAFGESIGKWPVFPDTIDALKRLHKHYKLVVLSNVDNESFALSNKGPLENFPFDGIYTAQDIGSYKPDLKNFEYLFQHVKDTFGIEKREILHTAQSQFHDHHPVHKFEGMKSAWIARYGAAMGNRDMEIYDWKFATLGEMADAVEREAAEKK